MHLFSVKAVVLRNDEHENSQCPFYIFVSVQRDFSDRLFSNAPLSQLVKCESSLQTSVNYSNRLLSHIDGLKWKFYGMVVLKSSSIAFILFMDSHFTRICSKFTSYASKEMMSFDEVYNNNKSSSQCYAVYGLSKLIMMMR